MGQRPLDPTDAVCRRRLSMILAGGVVVISAAAPAWGQARLQTYNTKYYIIHSDLDQDSVREAALRMTLMGRHYLAMSMIFVADLLDHPAKIELEATAVIPA